MTKFLRDFKPGPLDYYRKKSSFDWKRLKVLLDSDELVDFENEIVQELKEYSEFLPSEVGNLDDIRKRSARRSFIHSDIESLKITNLFSNLKKMPISNRLMMLICPDSSIKYNVSSLLFASTVQSMGTSRHSQFIEDSESGKINGCFCLTEIGHGTNTKGMKTTATFDENTKDFILNCPDFSAAKCWAGGLGQCASVGAVFAQLILKGENRGLHCFIAPIRDPKTLLPYPGVTVGDMGEKIGLNGIDNGFVMFKNYRIPREYLLNKLQDVTENGEYITPFKDPNKRHGASLGGLSTGRITITNMATAYGIKAITIAIRYAGIRKQFGPNDDEEVPILEYQTHQHRLLPYLAAAYALRIFCDYLLPTFYEFLVSYMIDPKQENIVDMSMEFHAVSSGCKPVASWTMRDAIQECREACGGHGYLKAAGIGDLRNSNDANCTYEGENHVLIQQTSNWLLKFWPLVLEGSRVSSPLSSINFLENAENILKTKLAVTNLESFSSPNVLMNTYKWLVCYLLRESYDNLERSSKQMDIFWAKNNNQVYLARSLSIAYIQHFILDRMFKFICDVPDENIKVILNKLLCLYAISSLEKHHLATLYRGGYAEGPFPATLIQESIVKLCSEIKDDAVALVDAFAPHDYAMNSVLGASDGQVYQRLENALLQSSYGMSRPKWWKDITSWKARITKAKL